MKAPPTAGALCTFVCFRKFVAMCIKPTLISKPACYFLAPVHGIFLTTVVLHYLQKVRTHRQGHLATKFSVDSGPDRQRRGDAERSKSKEIFLKGWKQKNIHKRKTLNTTVRG